MNEEFLLNELQEMYSTNKNRIRGIDEEIIKLNTERRCLSNANDNYKYLMSQYPERKTEE